PHRHGEFRLPHGVRHAQTMLAHLIDMGGPRIDERHILAGLHHMGAGIAADRARSDDGNLAAHSLPPCALFIVQRPLVSSAFFSAFCKTARGARYSALSLSMVRQAICWPPSTAITVP